MSQALHIEQFYLYSPNSTVLQEKCLSENSQLSSRYSIEIKGANILTIESGCTLSSKGYVFSWARQLIGEEILPIYVNALEGAMTQFLQQNPIDEELNSFLSQMIKRDNKGVRLADIESKHSLHKLHHKTNLTRQVFSAVTSLILMIGAVLILYICRKNLTQICSTKRPIGRGQPIRMTQLSEVIFSNRFDRQLVLYSSRRNWKKEFG